MLTTIGSNVLISQVAILSLGGNDMYSPSLHYQHALIQIKDEAWICLRATVLTGVIVGINSVVSAEVVLRITLPNSSLYIENSVRPIYSEFE